MNGGRLARARRCRRSTPSEGPRHYLRQFGAINARGLGLAPKRPDYERGNAYPAPNYLVALAPASASSSRSTASPRAAPERTANEGQPPCFVQPESLFDGRQFPRLAQGRLAARNPPPDNPAPPRPTRDATVGRHLRCASASPSSAPAPPG